MAMVYSLICWGGKDGKTVTFTDVGDVVNLTNHGLRTGTGIKLSTTGTLPTGLSASGFYYVRSTAANTFTLFNTAAEADNNTNQVTFTGTGTGTHTAKSKYYVDLPDKSRWTTGGTERVYASIAATQAARNSALVAAPTPNDTEVWEIGERFDEIITSSITVGIPDKCYGIALTTSVAGIRTTAYHGGIIGAGFRITSATAGVILLRVNNYNSAVDGLELYGTANNQTMLSATNADLATNLEYKNNIIHGNPAATGQLGMPVAQSGIYHDNLIFEIGGNGISITQYGANGINIYNNIVAKCTGYGFIQGTAVNARTFNNISIGNTLGNYSSWPPYLASIHSNNYGDAATDKKTATVNTAASTVNMTITAHGRSAGQAITFTSTGTLPTSGGVPLVQNKTYYVYSVIDANTIRLSTTGAGGGGITFDGNGTGTHYTTAIWSGDASEKYLDISTNGGNDVFVNYSAGPNYDFRPAGAAGIPNAKALQVDSGITIQGRARDLADNTVPNYQAATFPNSVDGGCYEFDHLEGAAPQQVTVLLTGMVQDSVLAIYKDSDGSAIVSPATIGASGTHSLTYTYTGDTPVTIKVRKGTAAPKYLPYQYQGTITSAGLSVNVSQVADPIA